MKKALAIITLLVFICGCTAKTPTLSANEYVEKLKESDLPIGDVIVYTAENDVNKLLGRPNQYISKVNFADTTLEQYDVENPAGGSVEVFESGKDVEARKAYIDSIAEASPMFAEYSYISGTALLRLNKSLTPDQAKLYSDAFGEIK